MLGIVGVLVATLAVASVGSVSVAVLFGIGLAVVWVASAPFAFAAAHLGLLVIPGIDSVMGILLIEVGLLTLLVAPMLASRLSTALLLATASSLSGLLVVLFVGFAWLGSVWGTAAGLIALAGLAGYVIDRYERLSIGRL